VAYGAEHGVGLIGMAALELIAAEMAVAFQVPDHRLDGQAASEFALDDAEDAAFLSGDEHAQRLWRIVAAIAFINIGPLDLSPGHGLRLLDHLARRMAIIRIAGQRLGVEDELAAFAAVVGGGDGDLHAELIRLVGFALADAFGLRHVPGIELAAALIVVLSAGSQGLVQGLRNSLRQHLVTLDLARARGNRHGDAGRFRSGIFSTLRRRQRHQTCFKPERGSREQVKPAAEPPCRRPTVFRRLEEPLTDHLVFSTLSSFLRDRPNPAPQLYGTP
jgi:hypothetical protein